MASVFDTKFVRLLQRFTKKELQGFKKWLDSPWCNSNKNLPVLVGELSKYYPRFTYRQLTKEELFERVLPDGKYSNRRLNNLMSEGFFAAKRFLAFNRFAGNELLQQQMWVSELQERHLDQWFFRETDSIIYSLSAKDVLSWDDRLSLFHLLRAVYHHPTQSPRSVAGDRTIVQMGEQLDILYLLEKAVIIEEKRSRRQYFKDEEHFVQADIRFWLAASEQVYHPAIALYRMRLSAPRPMNLVQWEKLRERFTVLLPRLSEREQKVHLLYLLNDTAQFVKQGVLDITAMLPLYKIGLRTNLLLHQGKLTRTTYTSVVVASNTNKEFEFTHHFIDTYTECVDDSMQSDCYRWARAHTAYWSRQLNQCIDILIKQEFDTPYFQHVSRVVRTQAYFDLYLKDNTYRDYLFSHFHNYERWLRREKNFSKTFNAAFLHFLQKCRQLARYYEEPTFYPGKVEKLLVDVRNIQALNWLKQKQNEILMLRQAD